MDPAADPKTAEPRPREKARVIGEMTRAVGSIRMLRGFLWALAAAGALNWAMLMADPAERSTPGPWLLAAFFLAFIGFMVTAALFVVRRPVPWTIACALVLTALNALVVSRGSFPGVIPVIVNVLAWVAVPRAMALERLLTRYPDLRYSRRLADGGVAPHSVASARLHGRS